jgi:hypothetical protein
MRKIEKEEERALYEVKLEMLSLFLLKNELCSPSADYMFFENWYSFNHFGRIIKFVQYPSL